MGIKCVFDESNPLYILNVYLPTSSHNDNEFLEYFDHLWALYDSLSVKGYVIVMGDCKDDLGNSLGDKSTRESIQRCCKLLEFADYFNLCPLSLLGSCGGPTDTFLLIVGDIVPHLITFFLPNCLFYEILSAKTFDLCAENTSDHLPIMVKLNQREFPYYTTTVSDECCIDSGKRSKIQWSKFSSEKIHEKYVILLLSDLSKVDMCGLIDSKTAADKLSHMLIDNSLSLVSSVPSTRKKTIKKISYVKLSDDVKAARSMCRTAFGSWKNHDFPSVGDIHDTYSCFRKEYRLLMRNFLNNLENGKVTKLCNAAESDEK